MRRIVLLATFLVFGIYASAASDFVSLNDSIAIGIEKRSNDFYLLRKNKRGGIRSQKIESITSYVDFFVRMNDCGYDISDIKNIVIVKAKRTNRIFVKYIVRVFIDWGSDRVNEGFIELYFNGRIHSFYSDIGKSPMTTF